MQVADAQALILDCKEYYAPLITPFEAWVAFQDLDLDPTCYRMDLASVHEAAPGRFVADLGTAQLPVCICGRRPLGSARAAHGAAFHAMT